MKEYSITVVKTNNPHILKFETNHLLVQRKNYEFKNIDEAKNSPLAQQLFYLPFIKTVYISGDFIGLERYDIVQWEDVKDEVAQQLVEYLNAGEPIVIEEDMDKPIPVTVYAEVTPNPSTMKFVASKKIVGSAFEFKNIDEARDSKLATELFQFPFVKQVFIDENYVSVSKYEVAEWDDITVELREVIRNFITEGKQIVADNAKAIGAEAQVSETITAESTVELDETSQEIVDILEEYVKPAVASDGGNIMFQSYDTDSKTVNVILQGACSGCPSSTFTLKNGIETMLKNMMGDKVNEVVALNG
ncbi:MULTISPECIES: NifU family protein [Maribacter]|uniref:Fe-S cluster biogenesis protein NfuA, 4Fe-4S-binding domain n=1 Tax=Maribacter dokdonensis TaxID=320912 RepID=A0ABY0US23_9FLAO|nr:MULTISPECIES: NifU family protein [Maribacter]APA64847.1 nitrogen fixation protein NifU [Maribacter sp. 1_2014MBL_MicDiv]SDT10138.1 Fe-S cluster biogenesis protein NfuA, 4Fe-4S-binding domain [Maribacter dokdonensis]HAI38837.1 NifU family protein [Maribacter sp.]|tara:strand:- start:16645 stop:17556 length:912 start_codon:yes stop_codon:yes gene_type:complete